MSEITEGLFLGSFSEASDLGWLQGHGITSILNVTKDLPFYFKEQFKYKRIPVDDEENTKINLYFKEIISFIEEGLSEGRVLVHCMFGISRSATAVMCYLIEKREMSCLQARVYVRSKRPIVKPNKGFISALTNYELLNHKKSSSKTKGSIIRRDLFMTKRKFCPKLKTSQMKNSAADKENSVEGEEMVEEGTVWARNELGDEKGTNQEGDLEGNLEGQETLQSKRFTANSEQCKDERTAPQRRHTPRGQDPQALKGVRMSEKGVGGLRMVTELPNNSKKPLYEEFSRKASSKLEALGLDQKKERSSFRNLMKRTTTPSFLYDGMPQKVVTPVDKNAIEVEILGKGNRKGLMKGLIGGCKKKHSESVCSKRIERIPGKLSSINQNYGINQIKESQVISSGLIKSQRQKTSQPMEKDTKELPGGSCINTLSLRSSNLHFSERIQTEVKNSKSHFDDIRVDSWRQNNVTSNPRKKEAVKYNSNQKLWPSKSNTPLLPTQFQTCDIAHLKARLSFKESTGQHQLRKSTTIEIKNIRDKEATPKKSFGSIIEKVAPSEQKPAIGKNSKMENRVLEEVDCSSSDSENESISSKSESGVIDSLKCLRPESKETFDPEVSPEKTLLRKIHGNELGDILYRSGVKNHEKTIGGKSKATEITLTKLGADLDSARDGCKQTLGSFSRSDNSPKKFNSKEGDKNENCTTKKGRFGYKQDSTMLSIHLCGSGKRNLSSDRALQHFGSNFGPKSKKMKLQAANIPGKVRTENYLPIDTIK